LQKHDRSWVADLRPEDRLILDCTHVQIEADRAAEIKALLKGDLDWQYLVQAATDHRVIPLLHQGLAQTCPEAVPAAVLTQLRSLVHDNTRYNLFLTQKLYEILDLFDSHEIPVIPFKGPVLAHSVYGNVALRQFGDLDLVVRKRDVLRAQELLMTRGYRPKYHLRSARELDSKKLDGQLELIGQGHVELHWELGPRHLPFALDLDRLWERLEPVSLGGKAVQTLAPEDSLVILCMHGAKHLWQRLAWIRDIAQLAGADTEIDWDGAVRQAGSLGGERMLFVGLFLAHDVLGASLPRDVWQRVTADPVSERLASQVRRWLFREPDGSPWVARELPFLLGARERWQDKLRYGLLRTFTPTSEDMESLPLPEVFSFLHYPLRPIRLLAKYGWARLPVLRGSAGRHGVEAPADAGHGSADGDVDTTKGD
jgi:hypothetical protein